VNAVRPGNQLEGRGPFGAEAPLRDRGVRVPLDVGDPVVLDVDELGAADRAVGADGLHDAVGLAGPGLQALASLREGGVAQSGHVAPPDLAQNGPFENGIERLEETHELPSSSGGTLTEEPSG